MSSFIGNCLILDLFKTKLSRLCFFIEGEEFCVCLIRGGAKKLWARLRRKWTRATKLACYSTYSPPSSINFKNKFNEIGTWFLKFNKLGTWLSSINLAYDYLSSVKLAHDFLSSIKLAHDFSSLVNFVHDFSSFFNPWKPLISDHWNTDLLLQPPPSHWKIIAPFTHFSRLRNRK